ncbi:MAG: guanylate kinase [Planctomycetota bacterium]|nr:guanylate kinase [Planctomycetota bacterium]
MIISGPSGVGKSTIIKEVLARTGVAFSISATTRSPRPGEVDGKHYHFVDRAAFEEMVDRGRLLEWAEVFGDLYGTPAKPVEDAVAAGRDILMDVDVQGAVQVHQKMPDATFVLITPPGELELARRLAGRASEPDEVCARRLEKAQKEIQTARQSGVYNHEVVNDDLETAVRQVTDILNRESVSQ